MNQTEIHELIEWDNVIAFLSFSIHEMYKITFIFNLSQLIYRIKYTISH